jgi:hypothetical protein
VSPSTRAGRPTSWPGRITLEAPDTDGYKLYAHQNEDIVRLTPEQLKAKMAAKEGGRTR